MRSGINVLQQHFSGLLPARTRKQIRNSISIAENVEVFPQEPCGKLSLHTQDTSRGMSAFQT